MSAMPPSSCDKKQIVVFAFTSRLSPKSFNNPTRTVVYRFHCHYCHSTETQNWIRLPWVIHRALLERDCELAMSGDLLLTLQKKCWRKYHCHAKNYCGLFAMGSVSVKISQWGTTSRQRAQASSMMDQQRIVLLRWWTSAAWRVWIFCHPLESIAWHAAELVLSFPNFRRL
jgi:hypothetical protein